MDVGESQRGDGLTEHELAVGGLVIEFGGYDMVLLRRVVFNE